MKHDYFHELILSICNELDIEYQTFNYKQIIKLTYENSVKYIWSKKFELNSATSTRIADNKSSTYPILIEQGIPCVPHIKYTCDYKNGRLKFSQDVLNAIKQNLDEYTELVIKPDNGYEGNDVFRINNTEGLNGLLERFKKPCMNIAISPYLDTYAEYRTIVLNNEPLFTYQKQLPFITGDGHKSITQLCNEYYYDYFNLAEETLTSYSPTYIPYKGERITVGWQYNLSQGSKSIEVQDAFLLKKIKELSTKAAKAININFASVDILQLCNGKLLVLEINSGVVLNRFIDNGSDNYEIAKNIYKRAILSMFQML